MTAILNVEPDRYSAEAHAILAGAGRVDSGPVNRNELLRIIPQYDAMIVRFGHRIDAEVISAGVRLRAIGCAATGTDHIDMAAAKRQEIKVISLRGETEFLRSIPASAECSWGLLLSLTRRIPAASAAVRRGEWNRDAFIGRDLAGKTLAILGCGRIGEKIARYAQAFGMRVTACDPYRTDLPAGVERRDTPMALVADADVVMVHVPLNQQTRNLVDAQLLAATPARAVLVNTARGGVLDEAALLDALRQGRLAGAALDVLSDENPRAVVENPLRAYATMHENLILTPHIGGATHESMAATEIFIARKLADFLKGRPGG